VSAKKRLEVAAGGSSSRVDRFFSKQVGSVNSPSRDDGVSLRRGAVAEAQQVANPATKLYC
jgi:hypothetical protein